MRKYFLTTSCPVCQKRAYSRDYYPLPMGEEWAWISKNQVSFSCPCGCRWKAVADGYKEILPGQTCKDVKININKEQ